MDRRDETLEPVPSYLTAPPPAGLFTRLARVALHLTRLQEESIEDLALRYSDYTVLAILEKEAAHEGLSVSQLAQLVLRPMGSITQVLDRLVKADLIERIPDPRDRRMVLIALTDDGRRVARHGRQVYDEIQARVLRDMDPEELESVDAGVRRLLDALEADQRET